MKMIFLLKIEAFFNFESLKHFFNLYFKSYDKNKILDTFKAILQFVYCYFPYVKKELHKQIYYIQYINNYFILLQTTLIS